MNDPARRWHPFGRTREEDLIILARGEETGFWDDDGRPAPWPENFLDPEAGWATSNDTNHADNHTGEDPYKPPFPASVLNRPETPTQWPEN